MSDRPSARNGKRSQAWGTLHTCPACGRCLCFSCHPAGPCVDDEARGSDVRAGRPAAGFAPVSFDPAFGGGTAPTFG